MLTVSAPAKINWSLYVLDRRGDGYHNILSLMHCIGLYDTLTFERSDTLELVSDMDIPAEDNLVFKAAEMLRKYSSASPGARITLKKEIPSGAGLGGGSSDAACTLAGLNRLWGLGLDNGALSAIGGRLGSDVPFFFHGPLAVAEGRGEVLTTLKIDVPYVVMVVKPPVSVHTGWAYEEIRARRRESGPGRRADKTGSGKELTKTDNKMDNIQFIYNALEKGDFLELKRFVYNDFESVVLGRHPVIGSIKETLLACGAALAAMSGSGSAVFGLFEDRERALCASGHFRSYFHKVVETLTTAAGNEQKDR